MTDAAPHCLASCLRRWRTLHTFGIIFLIHQNARETCTDLPSSGRTSHSTSDFSKRDRMGGNRINGPRLNQAARHLVWPCDWFVLLGIQRFKRMKQAAKEINPCSCSCPSPPHHSPPNWCLHQTTSVKQPTPQSEKYTTNNCSHGNPVTRQTQSTHKKGRKKKHFL